MSRRALVSGAAVVALYLLAASHLPPMLRPLNDGTAPPAPYIWVSPPPDASANGTPTGGTARSVFGDNGSSGVTLTTAETGGLPQAILDVPTGAFTPAKGERFVQMSVEPFDANTLAPPPPGLQFDSNAYTFTARYGAYKKPATFRAKDCTGDNQKLCPTLALRFMLASTQMARLENGAWMTIPDAGVNSGTLQMFIQKPLLGTFVTLAPVGATPTKTGGSGFAGYIAALIGTAALALALGISRRPRVRTWFRKKRKSAARALKR